MKRGLIIIFILLSVLSAGEERPKVGLVLGGGGGKGFFHIGVLKVLEEEKIPIDYIAGNSIGAIIGGFYSLGYSAAELEHIVNEIDWDNAFNDNPSRKDKPMEEKVFSERYAFSMPYKGLKFELPQGVVRGESTYLMLKKYTWAARNIKNFDNFPIPFRAVAGDLLTGEAVTFDSGDLAKVISASMAIPTIFTPVEIDGRLYCDGLIVRNLPVQDALDMGADKIIAVDVGTISDNVEDLSAIGILNHIVSFRSNDSTLDEIEKAEQHGLVIRSEKIYDYSSTDYSKRNELIALGERTAREHIEELRKLANPKLYENKYSIIEDANKSSQVFISEVEVKGIKDLDETVVFSFINKNLPFFITMEEMEKLIKSLDSTGYFKKVYYEILGETLVISVEERAQNNLRVGINVNNDEGTSIVFNTDINNIGLKGFKTVLDVEASQNPRASIQQFLYYGIKNLYGTILQAEYDADEFDVYSSDDYRNRRYSLDAFFGTITKTTSLVGLGLRQDYNIYEFNSIEKSDEDPASYFYLKWNTDTFDEAVFPKEGIEVNFDYKYSLSSSEESGESEEDEYRVAEGYAFEGLNFNFLSHTKVLSNRLSLILGGNYSYFYDDSGEEVLYSYYPKLGGIGRSTDSIEFLGLERSSVLAKKVTLYRAGLQFDLGGGLYLVYKTNSAEYEDIDGNFEKINGRGLTLGMRTLFGPLDVSVMNDVENGGTIYHFNFGFRL